MISGALEAQLSPPPVRRILWFGVTLRRKPSPLATRRPRPPWNFAPRPSRFPSPRADPEFSDCNARREFPRRVFCFATLDGQRINLGMTVSPLGDSAVVLAIGHTVDANTLARVRAVAAEIER